MAQITYTNKVALNENPEIANINKVTDNDMNEIKQVVNANYNNTIQITDTEPTDSDNKIWIDTSSLSQSDNTNMKYNDNGTYKDIYVKAFDTLPVGAIVEYSGSTIPSGWTDIGNNQIQKTSQYIEGGASLSNVYGTSNENGYTQEYINGLETYSTNEVRVGTWVDGKPLYRRAFTGTTSTTSHNYILTNTNDIAKLIGYKGYIEQSNTVQLEIGSSLYHSDSNINTSTRVINVDNNLRLDENYNVFGGKYFEVAVEYTKTTD